MPYLSVDELELLDFFGVEPHCDYPDAPWPYNDFKYLMKSGSVDISFSISPAERDVRIELKSGEFTFFELNASSVADIRLHKDNGRETLEIELTENDRLWFRLYPSASIGHEFKND